MYYTLLIPLCSERLAEAVMESEWPVDPTNATKPGSPTPPLTFSLSYLSLSV